MTPRIAVVGSINADLVVQMAKLPDRGETVSSAEPSWFPGGKGANQAVAAARMGASVAMFGAVGADEPGQMCLAALTQSGVNVDSVLKVSTPTSTALVMVEHTGENQIVVADGAKYSLKAEDIIYIGRGTREIEISGTADIYFTSRMCHADHPTTLVTKEKSDAVVIGDKKFASERTLRKYIHDQGVASSSMAMGITTIHEGSVWNTMPCHVHERRTEAYLYFDLDSNEKVIHLFGKPDQSRNFVLSNKEAVISPAWSIHTGAGTTNYKFVWSTAGENITYSDFNLVETKNLK